MAGLDRQKALIFATDAEVRLVTAFRTTEDETPTKTKQPNVIQNANYLQGWINNDNTGNVEPYAEDMNAVFYTLSYNTAYLYEKGIPEYSADQTYQQNSFCQYGGVIYRCKTDFTINVLPTNTTYWDKMETAAYSASNIGTTGAGVYASMTGNNFNFKKIKSSDSSVTITEGADYIDLKSYTGGGTAVFTANSPLTYSSGVLSISKADNSTNGYLSSADWTSFNSKLSSTIFSANNTWTGTNTFNSVATTSFTLNGSALATVAVTGDYGDLLNTPSIPTVNNATLTIQQNGTSVGTFTANASADVSLNIVETIQSASSPLSITSNALSISKANTSTNGYLSSTDWTTFNGKQNAINANNKLNTEYLNVNSNIIPTTNNTYDLGSSSSGYWNNLYINNINGSSVGYKASISHDFYINNSNKFSISDTLIQTTLSIRPNSSGSIDCGDETYYWRTTYTNEIRCKNANCKIVFPTSVASSTTEANITYSGNAVGKHIFTNGLSTSLEISSSQIIPHADIIPSSSYDLGSSSYNWNNVYTQNINYGNSSINFINVTEGGHKVSQIKYKPQTTTQGADEVVGHYFHISESVVGLSIVSAGSSYSASITARGGIYPYSDNSYDLGSPSKYWANVYSSSYYLSQYARLYTQSTYGAALQWQDSNSSTGRNLLFINNNIYPYQADTISLGQSNYKFTNVFSNKFSFSTSAYLDAGTSQSDVAMHWTFNSVDYDVRGYHANFMPFDNNKINLGANGYRWIKVFALSGTIDTSDLRTKNNIEPLENALDKVNSLGIKSFVYNDDPDHIHYGIIAQDELEKNAELIYVPEDYSEEENGGELGVISSNVKYLALKAIQELSAKVDRLEKQLGELK